MQSTIISQPVPVLQQHKMVDQCIAYHCLLGDDVDVGIRLDGHWKNDGIHRLAQQIQSTLDNNRLALEKMQIKARGGCSLRQVLIPGEHAGKGVEGLVRGLVGLEGIGEAIGVAEEEVASELQAREKQLPVPLLC